MVVVLAVPLCSRKAGPCPKEHGKQAGKRRHSKRRPGLCEQLFPSLDRVRVRTRGPDLVRGFSLASKKGPLACETTELFRPFQRAAPRAGTAGPAPATEEGLTQREKGERESGGRCDLEELHYIRVAFEDAYEAQRDTAV